jgi:hypothetical protein
VSFDWLKSSIHDVKYLIFVTLVKIGQHVDPLSTCKLQFGQNRSICGLLVSKINLNHVDTQEKIDKRTRHIGKIIEVADTWT